MLRAGVDGRARSCLFQPSALGRRGMADNSVFMKRSTTPRHAAARSIECRDQVVHGASPGHDLLSLAYLILDAPDAKALRVRSDVPGDHPAAAERVPKAGAFQLHTAEFSAMRATANEPKCRCACSTLRTHRYPRSVAVQWPLPRDGYECGRRLQPLERLAVTRWREDATCDNWARSATSATPQARRSGRIPISRRSARDKYEAIFSEGRAEFRRRDLDYDTHTEIVFRRKTTSNCAACASPTARGCGARSRLRVTRSGARRAGRGCIAPAFSNLFVQTEIVRERQAILCTRRPRSLAEQAPWMFS